MDPITLGLIGLGAYLLFGSSSSGFTYRQKHGSWRAYFNSEPRSKAHVLHDNDGYYVCWDRSLRTEQEARRVAERWKEIYG